MSTQTIEKNETDAIKSHWWTKTLKGILFIIVGFIALYHPGESLLTVGLFIGYFWLASGIIYFIALFSKSSKGNRGWIFLEALLDVVLGLMIISSPVMTLELLPFFIGFSIIFAGISQIALAFDLGEGFAGSKVFFIILGILSLIFGVIIINSPVVSGISIVTIIGVYFIAYGIIKTILSFTLKSKE